MGTILMTHLSSRRGWGRGVLHATLDVFRPIANVLFRVEHQVRRARHVMFSLALAHVVHGAVRLVRMIGYVTVLFLACHRSRWKRNKLSSKLCRIVITRRSSGTGSSEMARTKLGGKRIGFCRKKTNDTKMILSALRRIGEKIFH